MPDKNDKLLKECSRLVYDLKSFTRNGNYEKFECTLIHVELNPYMGKLNVIALFDCSL